jgi:hypothetical protein
MKIPAVTLKIAIVTFVDPERGHDRSTTARAGNEAVCIEATYPRGRQP